MSTPLAARLQLRPQVPADSEFLAALYASTRSAELARVQWSDADKQAFVRLQFAAQTAHYNAAFPTASRDLIVCEGTPVGRLYLDRRPDEIRVIDVAVLPSHRGLGIGSLLLGQVLAEARDTQRVVRVHVERDNPAQTLYLRLGFRPVQTVGLHWLMQWDPEPERLARACSND